MDSLWGVQEEEWSSSERERYWESIWKQQLTMLFSQVFRCVTETGWHLCNWNGENRFKLVWAILYFSLPEVLYSCLSSVEDIVLIFKLLMFYKFLYGILLDGLLFLALILQIATLWSLVTVYDLYFCLIFVLDFMSREALIIIQLEDLLYALSKQSLQSSRPTNNK
jgi:hypothetical protein